VSHLELCAVLRVENCSQNKREAGNDLFFVGANHAGRKRQGAVGPRSKKEDFVQQYLCSEEKVLRLCITFSEDTRLLDHYLWPSGSQQLFRS
jgi:hypothetical protein